MRYQKELTWEVVPSSTPKVKKNCSKCGQHALFDNSKKFRVNANKNKIDVWLIYQCEKCKTTWNMTIFERIAPTDIPSGEYELFMNNDESLAKFYGFNKSIHAKNKVQVDYETVKYEVFGEALEAYEGEVENPGTIGVTIICETPFDIRLEKILSEKLKLSRSKVKKLCLDGDIIKEDQTIIKKEKTSKISKIEIKSLKKISI